MKCLQSDGGRYIIDGFGWHRAKHISECTHVIFTGGADVDPSIYGDAPSTMCNSYIGRDMQERTVFDDCMKRGLKMVGICRGAQLLSALLGGKLVHHVSGHGVGHLVETTDGLKFGVTSCHHQMVLPHAAIRVEAWSSPRLGHIYYGNHDQPIAPPEVEVEAWSAKNIFSVQFHPEWMHDESEGRRWFIERVMQI